MKSNLKITILLFLLAGLSMPLFQGCNKYPEGPAMSLRTRTARVANTWKVENYKLNDNDLTSLVTDYTETFSKDGNYSYSWGSSAGTGSWAFQKDDEEIRLTGNTNQDSYTMVILKLEEKTFWYYYMDGNDKNEFHMVKK